MSHENMERMRQTLDAFDRRDRSAWLALHDPDCEVLASGAWPDADVISGREAAWDFYVQVVEAFEPRAFGDVDLVDAGDDKVLAHQRTDVRGRASGADVQVDYWTVVTFRKGTIVRDQWFADRSEALEAVGLRE